MNQSSKILNDIISVVRDGKAFYDTAIPKVRDPELKTLFTRMAAMKGEILTGLSAEVKSMGEAPAPEGTWTGDLSKLYGELRAAVGDNDYAWVSQLENSEDRLLKAFDEAIQDTDTPVTARATLNRFVPEVRACHDIMRSRKHALKKAA
jgi:uncharacterized protein (TIGR02284 family)